MELILNDTSDDVSAMNDGILQNTDVTDKITKHDTIETELRRQNLTLNELVSDNPRLSLDWQSFRKVVQCSCASPINSLTRKVSLVIIACEEYFYMNSVVSYLFSITVGTVVLFFVVNVLIIKHHYLVITLRIKFLFVEIVSKKLRNHLRNLAARNQRPNLLSCKMPKGRLKNLLAVCSHERKISVRQSLSSLFHNKKLQYCVL